MKAQVSEGTIEGKVNITKKDKSENKINSLALLAKPKIFLVLKEFKALGSVYMAANTYKCKTEALLAILKDSSGDIEWL